MHRFEFLLGLLTRARRVSPLLYFMPAAILLIQLLSCAPGPKIPPETATIIPAPHNLTVDSSNGKAVLKWQIARDANFPIAGYNIYCQSPFELDTSISAIPYNHPPFPGDTDGDINNESFEITGLINGREYTAFVRTIGLNNKLSTISNICSFTPVIKGEFTIDNNHLREGSGYCFELMKSTVARDTLNDIYLYATENRIGLSSPHRLGAGLRHTYFNSIILSETGMETVPIREGDDLWIQSKFGYWDLTVTKIDKINGKVEAKIDFVSKQWKIKSP